MQLENQSSEIKMINLHGGSRPGAGRKPGARAKRTCEILDAAKAGGMLPHEFLCAVSQGWRLTA